MDTGKCHYYVSFCRSIRGREIIIINIFERPIIIAMPNHIIPVYNVNTGLRDFQLGTIGIFFVIEAI